MAHLKLDTLLTKRARMKKDLAEAEKRLKARRARLKLEENRIRPLRREVKKLADEALSLHYRLSMNMGDIRSAKARAAEAKERETPDARLLTDQPISPMNPEH